MKFTSIFFKANANIFKIYLKDTNEREINELVHYFSKRMHKKNVQNAISGILHIFYFCCIAITSL